MGTRGTILGLAAGLGVTSPLTLGAWTGAAWIAAVPMWLVGFSMVSWLVLAEVAVLLLSAVLLALAGKALRYCTPAAREARRRGGLRGDLCRWCGYPTAGLPQPRCPECGGGIPMSGPGG